MNDEKFARLEAIDHEIKEYFKTALNETATSLAARGLIYDTGERRNGEICWALTPKGLEAADAGSILPFPTTKK